MKRFAILSVAPIAVCLLAPTAGAQKTVKVLYAWPSDGNPQSNLVFDSAGNLYGTTSSPYVEGTTVYELTPNPDGRWTQNVLWASPGGAAPNNVRPGVVFDATGNMYATSFLGGNNGCGAVFELTPSSGGTWSENNLFDFDCASTGAYPVGGVTFDTAGNLYGTATQGGNSGNGVVYELTPNSDGTWIEKVLYDFTGGSDGAYPDHPFLIFDSAGNLYGSAALGGQGNCPLFGGSLCGTIFKMTPQASGTWAFTVLHTFTGGFDGGNPEGTLVFDKSGSLYGTTYGGGAYGLGVAFELTPLPNGQWGERVLHPFRGGADGSYPAGGLIFDAAGNLYGDTLEGGNRQCDDYGALGCGIVYELSPNSTGRWKENILARFHGEPNNTPWNALVMDSLGNLYGTAAGFDTYSSGSVYEIVRQ